MISLILAFVISTGPNQIQILCKQEAKFECECHKDCTYKEDQVL